MVEIICCNLIVVTNNNVEVVNSFIFSHHCQLYGGLTVDCCVYLLLSDEHEDELPRIEEITEKEQLSLP